MSAMENTLAAAPGNEEQLQELHRTMKARAEADPPVRRIGRLQHP